jgi:hypothetical protein
MDENNWYYNDNGKATGPLTLNDLRQHLTAGGLHPGTLVWHQTLVQWMPANQVPGLLPPMPPAVPSPPVFLPPAPSNHHGMAVTAFVLAIVGLFIPCGGFLLAIPAIILAIIALSGMSQAHRREGHGLAVAAIVIGIVACICHGALLFNMGMPNHHYFYYYHCPPMRWHQWNNGI